MAGIVASEQAEAAEPPSGKVIDLMAALKASLAKKPNPGRTDPGSTKADAKTGGTVRSLSDIRARKAAKRAGDARDQAAGLSRLARVRGK